MALGIGEGSETNLPLARAVIGGLMVSTFFTLFLVPALYTLLDRFRQAPGSRRGRSGRGDRACVRGSTIHALAFWGLLLRRRGSLGAGPTCHAALFHSSTEVAPESGQAAEKISLTEAVRRALARNPTAVVAMQEIRRAEALLVEARAGSMPSLMASGTLTAPRCRSDLWWTRYLRQNQQAANLLLNVPLVAPRAWTVWSESSANLTTTRPAARIFGGRSRLRLRAPICSSLRRSAKSTSTHARWLPIDRTTITHTRALLAGLATGSTKSEPRSNSPPTKRSFPPASPRWRGRARR
jgi:hypothetical protein